MAREMPADQEAREEMLRKELSAFLVRLADWARADEDEDEE
jgi:hypothetical protein